MSATVWVVDDEETVRSSLGIMLKELGYDVQMFDKAEDALSNLAAQAPDVVITDVRMPGMSGMDLTRALLDKCPEIIIMILTGYPSIPDAVESIRNGAVDFLSKPCRIEEIRLRIERALENRNLQGRLKKARMFALLAIVSLPLWFILGILLARLLQM